MDPGPHAEKGSLRSCYAAVHHRQFRPVTIWAPPDQILDPPLLTSPCQVCFVLQMLHCNILIMCKHMFNKKMLMT